MRGGKVVCVGSLALLLALVAAPAGRADDGPPTGASASAADAPGSAAEAPGSSADSPAQAADSPGNPANAPGPSPDPPGNSENASGDAGDGPGNSENAPGHAGDGPGNSENAPGHAADGPGNSENAPGHASESSPAAPAAQADQGASIGQGAEASASAGQEQVGNTQVSVRVDEPGNGAPVGQENHAEADAAASASATTGTSGTANVDQDVQANADGTQSDVGNTAVTVRVGSPGDDGAVSQSNVAGATAATASDNAGTEAANASAGQDGVANTSVSVRVFSPGDDGSVTQSNEASASAHTSNGSGANAAASQDGVRNTSVSIRVESPGTTGSVSQANDATASADGVAVAVSSDAVNTLVAVAVGATDLDRPGPAGLQVWVWEWVWERDESESLQGAIGADVTSWVWDWGKGGPKHGTVTSRAAGDDDGGRKAGSWEWRWDWDRQGVAGWSWSWDWNQSLGCESCIWVWNWSWSWSGQPDEITRQQAPVQAGSTPTGQLNEARAEADAEATVQVEQSVTQDGAGDGTQYLGQLVDVTQNVEAVATATQTGIESFAWGFAPLRQSNIAESVATAVVEATVVQEASQVLVTGNDATADQWGGQQVDVAQTGYAESATSQHDALLTGAGSHSATGHASAGAIVAVDQSITQDGAVEGATLDQWVGQLTLVEQAVDAASTVDQVGTSRSRVGGGKAAATVSAGGLALVEQGAEQTAARSRGVGEQTAAQLVFVGQDAFARATTAQQAGTAGLPLASSEAVAANRVAVVQAASQAALGLSDLDIQDLSQQSIVVQTAIAVSTSNGGIGGAAVVVNCAVTQQGAAQSLGAGAASVSSADLTAFCFPPEPAQYAADPEPAPPTSLFAAESLAPATPTAMDDEPALFRGHPKAAASSKRAAHRAPANRAPANAGMAPFGAKHGRPELGSTKTTQFSALHSTQARLDTRPGSYAGAGDAGREPPLPPAGDPPTWISSLAAAASGAGSSGIAAILLAFALVPPLMRRVPEGSVVRRPTDVLAPIDVPV